jgi:hypothetical protein
LLFEVAGDAGQDLFKNRRKKSPIFFGEMAVSRENFFMQRLMNFVFAG